MVMFLLTVHIILAVISLGYASGVIDSTRKKLIDEATDRTRKMWLGTLATTASGVLMVVAGSPIGRFCVSLLIFMTVIVIAHSYQRAIRIKLLRSSEEV